MIGTLLNSTSLLLASEFAEETANASNFPMIPALIITPLIGAIIIALIPRSRSDLYKQIAVITSVITGALSIAMLVAF